MNLWLMVVSIGLALALCAEVVVKLLEVFEPPTTSPEEREDESDPLALPRSLQGDD